MNCHISRLILHYCGKRQTVIIDFTLLHCHRICHPLSPGVSPQHGSVRASITRSLSCVRLQLPGGGPARSSSRGLFRQSEYAG